MRSVLAVLCINLFAFSATAQQTFPTNNLLLGYQEFPTVIHGHAADAQGNQYYNGMFRGQLKIKSQVLATGNGLDDVFWVKTDPDGNVLRSKTFGTSFMEYTFANGMAMGEKGMLYQMLFFEPMTLDGISAVPYTYANGNKSANAIIYADTSGTVKWVKKTNLQFQTYFANNVFHLIGTIFFNTGAIKLDDTIVVDSVGRSGLVHLMLDETGKFLGAKTITARKINQMVTLSSLNFFSDKKMLLHVKVDGDTLFYINTTPHTLPGTYGNYHLLLKTDTSYLSPKTKYLNPLGQSLAGPGLVPPVCIAPNDSVYTVMSVPTFYTIDGFTQIQQRNTLYAMDTSLTVRRMASLNTISIEGFPTTGTRRKFYFRQLLYQNGLLYLNGVYYGTNESPNSAIAKRDTSVTVLPGVDVLIDKNGPSKSFMATCNSNGQNGSFKWYGDHREYESNNVAPAFLHKAGLNRLAFVQLADNTWNPWTFDEKLNPLTGSMQKNADRPEIPFNIRFFDDGSRVVMGYARGKTALDSTSTPLSNGRRADAFIARLRSDNQVLWYKRLHSTLLSPDIRNLEIKNNKAWFLVNYVGSVNDSNFISVDTATYAVGANASLMASIDTTGNLAVLNLTNPVLQKASLRSFSFFANGDLALGNDGNYIAYQNFPAGTGACLFRVNPSTGAIIAARKLYGTCFPFIQTIQIDQNDRLYISGNPNTFGINTSVLLHDGNKLIDSIRVTLNSNSQSLLKMEWSRFHWYKRFAAVNFGTSGPAYGDLLLLNQKPVMTILGSNQPTAWEGQPVHDASTSAAFHLVALDSNGLMQRSRSLSNISFRNIRPGKNGQLYFSGTLISATTIDTIQLGHAGYGDGIGLVLDSNFIAKRSFRVATPYSESLSDMDIFRDSIVALAYTAQTAPQFYLNRTMADASDYEEDAYVGSITTRSNVITSINTPLPLFTSISVIPNPVQGSVVLISAKVMERLSSAYRVYESNGRFITGGTLVLTPDTLQYSFSLPAVRSKGVYYVVISNKKWTTSRSFIVL